MFLAIREMRFAKARYTLIAVIMVLLAFLVLFITGLAQGLAYDSASSVKNMKATHFMMEEHSDRRFTRSQIGDEQAEQAQRMAGSGNAAPLGVRMTTVVPAGDSAKVDVTLLAVDLKGWLAPTVVEGISPAALAAGDVLADQSLQESGVSLGTVLADQASGMKWTVRGFVKNESFSHTPVVFLTRQAWSELNAQSPRQGGTGASGLYNAIAIKASASKASELEKVLPGTEVITKADAVSAIPGYKEEQGSLTMMIAFLFIISAFVLAVFFYVITIQKTAQFGILKAIGTRTPYLAKSVAVQVLVLSVGSLAVSILLVKLFEAALPSSMPFQLGLSSLSLTCLSFLGMSMAGSLFSVWKVAKIDALDAIGRAAA